MRKIILVLTLVCFLSVPALLRSDEPFPTDRQATVRLLRGSRGTDVWDSTFTGRDTVSVAFRFYNPDSSDTLDLPPSGVLIASTVLCSVWTYGGALDFIDEDRPLIIYANESWTIPARVRWVHVVASAAGSVRMLAVAE